MPAVGASVTAPTSGDTERGWEEVCVCVSFLQ